MASSTRRALLRAAGLALPSATLAPRARPEQPAAMLRSHTRNHHPAGADLRTEIATYVDELTAISVIKPSTDAIRFSDKVYAYVLS